MNMLLDVTPHRKPVDIEPKENTVIDKSHKFFIISTLLKEQKIIGKYNCFSLSEEIKNRSNIYISPEECQDLIKEYRFLLNRPNTYSIFLSAITGLLLLYTSDYNAINIVFMLLLLPAIFNFYNNILIKLKLFSFNSKSLIPPNLHDEKYLDTVTIVIASRNEPFPVAKMTFDSAMSLQYPSNKKQIIVVDNSDTNFEDFAKWQTYVTNCKSNDADVEFIHRQGTEGYKPRNLDIALQYASGEYILYMDIDSTLTKDTLLRVIPLFRYDEKLAFIQLQAVPTNAKGKSSLAIAQSIQNYFLRMETIFLSHSSHSLFYGHNAIWKTKAIREMGECLEYYNNEVVVTEDLSMSLRTLFKGYHGSGTWIQSGEWVPESMRETESMWLRWTVGTYQVFAKHKKEICTLIYHKPRDFSGWLQHITSLINNGMTPIYVCAGMILNSNLLMFIALLSLLPDITQSLYASTKLSLEKKSTLEKLCLSYKGTFILTSYINWIKLVGLFRFLTGQKQGWKPTGKTPEKSAKLLQIISKHFMYLLFSIFCILYSLQALFFNQLMIANAIMYSVCGIYGMHSLLSVCVFGASGMMETTEAAAAKGNINDYSEFYT